MLARYGLLKGDGVIRWRGTICDFGSFQAVVPRRCGTTAQAIVINPYRGNVMKPETAKTSHS
ncbi:hypothetical protein [Bifidobacterium myosotis]|uniref:Uncharacterized protein n=1 Tax=Bifidobacterium myosotis TaxID=1630166 RepID=A0A5M9ZQ26_9BIFI|nr:hypothetical protein [Bifidobacterium myosotis]KAA8829724.1 hypothetical protein EMO91_01780 [Bifidobacterium myosotis]